MSSTAIQVEAETQHAVSWFEIPVTDLDRATTFYQAVLGAALHRETFFGTPMSVFPKAGAGIGGALVLDARLSPGSAGALVYLDVAGKLDACLERVAAAGGKVVTGRTGIGPAGFIALVRDHDDNLVGLHSPV